MVAAVYLNGEYVDAAAAKVSVFDSAFMSGLAVFETVKLEEGGEPEPIELFVARAREPGD